MKDVLALGCECTGGVMIVNKTPTHGKEFVGLPVARRGAAST